MTHNEVNQFLDQFPAPLPLRSVVRCNWHPKMIGVVVGIVAPESPSQHWSYQVVWTEGHEDSNNPHWMDGDQIEEVNPSIVLITPESHPEVWAKLQPPQD